MGMWIKTQMLNDADGTPRFESVKGNPTYNRVVRDISRHFQLPTITTARFRRDKEIILGEGEDRLLIQILSELPPGAKDETLPQ